MIATSTWVNSFMTVGCLELLQNQQHGWREMLATNASMTRSDLARQYLDPRRDLNRECGYPETSELTAETYKAMFDREAVAARCVEILPRESWQITPEVFEDDEVDTVSEFEQAWLNLGRSLRGKSWHQDERGSAVWEYLLRADVLSGIGHFGILLLGIDDGRNLQEPVEGAMIANDSLMMSGEENKLRALKELTTNEERAIDGWVKQRQGNGQAHNIAASEIQYDSQSLAGTDEQYAGVQFGPSEQESDQPAKAPRKLLFLRPFDESLVQIVRYESNVNNPRFGQPVMYRVTLNDPREQHSGVGLPIATVFVHWTRVIHLADNLNSSEIFGVPRMRPVFNNLMNLQKLYGGSAEMYWKGAFPGYAFQTHPQLGGDITIDLSAVRAQMEQYMNGLQRWLAPIGASVNSLAPQVVDPTSQIAVQIEAICIKLGIPVPVFKGYEIGEQASTNNDSDWNGRLAQRQNGYVTPRIIVPFIDRLILLGVLPEPEGYSVVWPDLNSLSESEKADIGLKHTQMMAQYVSGQVEAIMRPDTFFVRELGMTNEEARAALEAVIGVEDEELLTSDAATQDGEVVPE